MFNGSSTLDLLRSCTLWNAASNIIAIKYKTRIQVREYDRKLWTRDSLLLRGRAQVQFLHWLMYSLPMIVFL